MSHIVFALLLPVTCITLQTKDREVDTLINGADKEEQEFWPFDNIFGGGGGKKSGGPYKQKLQNIGDTEYFGEIQVGGQKIKAIIDTGSFELLVFEANCSVCGSPKDLYNSSKSKTSTVIDFDASHSFGSGTTYSKEVVDKVKIGGTTIDNQSFWAVVNADMYILAEGNFQAIFGVGPPTSAYQFAVDDATAVHKELKDMKKAGENITKRTKDIVAHYDDVADYMKTVISVAENLNTSNMSICLGLKSNSPGYFVWDDDELQKQPESFLTIDVIGDYYWSTSLGEVHLAGAVVQQAKGEDNVSKDLTKLANGTIDLGCPKANCSAIIDTGTSLLVAPYRVVDAIYDLADSWEAAGGSCEDLSQLPELRFTLNGATLSLPPESYMGYVSGSDFNDALANYMPRLVDKHRMRTNRTHSRHKHRRGKKHQIVKPGQKGDGDVAYYNYYSSSDSGEDGEDIAAYYYNNYYSSSGAWGDDSEWSYCEPLIMSLDADSQFGELWIFGMPFFRKFYTTFSFNNDGETPIPATMSFSEQDGKCKPGIAPQPIKEKPSKAKKKWTKKSGSDSSSSTTTSTESSTEGEGFSEQRPAQLKVYASKILVPRLVRKLNLKAKKSSLIRPFVRI